MRIFVPKHTGKHWKKSKKKRQQAKQRWAGFYATDAWRELRYKVLKTYGPNCMCCGAAPSKGRPAHVDHIKPRINYQHLELDFNNLQVLCVDCNYGKSAWDTTDWRPGAKRDQQPQDKPEGMRAVKMGRRPVSYAWPRSS